MVIPGRWRYPHRTGASAAPTATVMPQRSRPAIRVPPAPPGESLRKAHSVIRSEVKNPGIFHSAASVQNDDLTPARLAAEHFLGVDRVEVFFDRTDLSVTHDEQEMIGVLVGL